MKISFTPGEKVSGIEVITPFDFHACIETASNVVRMCSEITIQLFLAHPPLDEKLLKEKLCKTFYCIMRNSKTHDWLIVEDLEKYIKLAGSLDE